MLDNFCGYAILVAEQLIDGVGPLHRACDWLFCSSKSERIPQKRLGCRTDAFCKSYIGYNRRALNLCESKHHRPVESDGVAPRSAWV